MLIYLKFYVLHVLHELHACYTMLLYRYSPRALSRDTVVRR